MLLPPAIEINELIMPASNFPRGDSQHHSARLGGNGPIPFRHQRVEEQIQLEDQALIYAVKRIANQRGISVLAQLTVWEMG